MDAAPDRPRNTCSRCGELGHNLRTCTAPPEVNERHAEIAALRAESDALAEEIVQYEAVVDRCTVRIGENRRRLADNEIRIRRLRGGA